MLGKTNITTLQDGAIIEDIANYGWIQQSVSITGNFKKTLVENGYLVGVTANGEIVYTKDGEIWKRLTLSQNSVKINDIEWDGSRFIFVGSHVLDGQETPLIVTTVDFSTYKTIDMMDFLPESTYAKDKVYQIFSIYHENGNYIIFASGGDNSGGRRLTLFYGDLKTSLKLVEKKESSGTKLKEESVRFAKNSSKTIIFMEGNYESGYSGTYLYFFRGSSSGMETINSGDAPLTLFNAKDRLYYASLLSNHELVKFSDTDEKIVMTTGINWEFVDGVYFNECDLFISAHNMLIVKKGEKIIDKTLDDLIEIAPEKTMTCIEKAFGRLFIFGNSGLILKSTNEGNSSEGVLVQHLSAKQALEDSKAYTDSKSFMTLANNLATTVPGSALDAVQGKKLNDIITNFLNLLPLMQAEDYGGKDFNTHPYNKILQVGYDSGCLNAPTEKFYGIAIKLKTYQQYCFQLAIRIDNGEVSNLFMRFNIGSTWSGWRTICINTEYRMRHYSHLAQLGLSVDSVENLSTILKAMPKDSILEFDVNATDIQPLFEKKIIPTAAAGYIQFHGIGRGRVTYTTDQSDLYVLGIHNRGADIGTYSKWKKYTGTEVT